MSNYMTPIYSLYLFDGLIKLLKSKKIYRQRVGDVIEYIYNKYFNYLDPSSILFYYKNNIIKTKIEMNWFDNISNLTYNPNDNDDTIYLFDTEGDKTVTEYCLLECSTNKPNIISVEHKFVDNWSKEKRRIKRILSSNKRTYCKNTHKESKLFNHEIKLYDLENIFGFPKFDSIPLPIINLVKNKLNELNIEYSSAIRRHNPLFETVIFYLSIFKKGSNINDRYDRLISNTSFQTNYEGMFKIILRNIIKPTDAYTIPTYNKKLKVYIVDEIAKTPKTPKKEKILFKPGKDDY